MDTTSTTSTANTSSGGQLGHIVSWRVPSSVGIHELRLALQRAGLDHDLAADMAPRNALSRALREMKQGRVIRKLRQENDLLWFQFTAEHMSDREVTYDKEAELSLDVTTGAVWCSVNELQLEAQVLLNEHLGKRLTSDLTRLVQKIYESRRADLVPIREQGGAYFVPDMHRDVVDKVRSLLSAIGGTHRSFAVRLGSGDTNASVAESLCEYLKDMIAEYRESVADVSKETRTSVVDNRLSRSKEIRQRMECYSGLMGSFVAMLGAEMDAADSELIANMQRELAGEPQQAVA